MPIFLRKLSAKHLIRPSSTLNFDCQTVIKLATSQIIRHGILYVVDIGHPVVAAHVGDIKQVEHIKSDRDILEMTPEIVWSHAVGRCADKLIAQADVDTRIGRCTELCLVASDARSRHGQTIGEDASQAKLQLRNFREIVCVIKCHAVTLIARHPHADSIESLTSLH